MESKITTPLLIQEKQVILGAVQLIDSFVLY